MLKAIDELFGETATTVANSTPLFSSLPNHCSSSFQGLQYAPALERALLEGHHEQSSIVAVAVGVGGLSLSPEINMSLR